MRGSTGHRKGMRLTVVALALATALPGLVAAHPTTSNAFVETFESISGPLPGFQPSHAWQISGGQWDVIDQTGLDAPAFGAGNKILVQSTKTKSPDDAIAFVRGRVFRELTVQVTAAFIPELNQQLSADPQPGSSLCLVFRAPVTDGLADRDNLYLFCAEVSGVNDQFPTGKGYVLWKRVGRTYFAVSSKIAPTWDDLHRPHDYKIVMGRGRVQAFVDGRLVADHVDVPNGDFPTLDDPFPALPFESGAVGLRTSSARAWFDNFVVVGNDAAEGRAAAITAFAQYGNSAPNIRRGAVADLGRTMRAGHLGLPTLDTGFVYHDHDGFDDAAVRSIDNPNGGQPSFGGNVRVTGVDGVTTAEASLSGAKLSFTDPGGRISVFLDARAVSTKATASCSATTSSMALADATLTLVIHSVDPRVPDTPVSIALAPSYAPNTLLAGGSLPVLYSVVAHAVTTTTAPRRATVSALRIQLPGSDVNLQQVRTPGPSILIDIAPVTAARYCP